MANIYALGRSTQFTSAGMVTTTYDIYSQAGVRQSTPQSALIVTTNPTFAGIQSVIAQLNGSLLLNWNAATGPNGPYYYDIYVQESSNVGVFNSANLVISDTNLSTYIFELANGDLLRAGFTYYVGVKARDPLGNISLNTTLISAVSVGVAPGRPLTPSDISTIVAAVWNEAQSGYATAGTFGKYLDAQVSTRATQSSVNSIPTNPLLITDSRLNTLDANISSRSTQTSVDNINTKIGTPVSSVSADIAAVKADTNTINGKIGTPVSSVSADIAAVKAVDDAINAKVDVTLSTRSSQTSVDNINTKIGTPVSSVSADIAAVKAVDDAIKTQTDKFSFDGSNYINAHTKVNDDKVNYTLSSANVSVVSAAIWDETRSTHITSGTFGESNQGVISNTRASNLDNLDATVSSRATQTSVNSIQSTVNSIQGQNVDEVIVIPATMSIPATGSEIYRVYFNHAQAGLPADPDYGPYIEIVTQDGTTTIISSVSMTQESTGVFYYDYTLTNTAYQGGILVKVTHKDLVTDPITTTIIGSYQSESEDSISQIAQDTGTLVSRLTATRASNLDNLDATVSSRATQTSVNAIDTKLGTPANASVSADIASVKSDTNTINTRVDVTLSTRSSQTSVNAIDTKLGTPANASVSADIAAIQTTADNIDGNVDVAVSTRATQSSVDTVPTAGENAVAVWEEDVNAHATGTTTARTLKDAKIFSQIDL